MPRKKSTKDVRRQHRATDFRDTKAELELVAGVVRSKEIMEVMHGRFDSQSITSDKIKWIYDKAVHLYEYENELLCTRTFKYLLDMPKSKRKIYLSLWKKVQKKKLGATMASTLACMDKLSKFYVARSVQIGIKNSIAYLDKALSGDMDSINSAQAEVVNMHDNVVLEKEDAAIVIDPIKGYDQYKKDFKRIQKDPSSVMGVPTGVEQIDNHLLGLRKGELGLVCGPSGGGKSIMIMNFGAHAWQVAGDVLAYTIEMSEQQYRSRWYCHLSGIEYNRFRQYCLSKEEWNILDKTIEKSKKNKHKFRIIDMPQGCSVAAIRAETKKATRKLDPALIIIDYMNIMCGPNGKIDFSWQNQLEIATQLKLGLARLLDVPVWSACQTDGKDGVGFSTHIKDQLDVGGLLEHDEATKETGIMFWKWFKERDFKGETVTLQTAMNHMRMTPLPNNLEKRANKLKLINKQNKRVKV